MLCTREKLYWKLPKSLHDLSYLKRIDRPNYYFPNVCRSYFINSILIYTVVPYDFGNQKVKDAKAGEKTAEQKRL